MNDETHNKARELLLDALVTGDAGAAIMRQEARGQRELVYGERLPRAGTIESESHSRGPGAPDPVRRAALETWGFRFGELINDLFVQASLPAGWTIAATSHPMHSEVRDGMGRKRMGIFYKAAFYDERADASIIPRYSVSQHFGDWDGPAREYGSCGPTYALVIDNGSGAVIYHSDPVLAVPYEDPTRHQVYAKKEAQIVQARAWLTAHYPDHKDPCAYWEVS